MNIEFQGEAGETFANVVRDMIGYCVQVTPEGSSEPFDAEIVGTYSHSLLDHMDDAQYDDIVVKTWDDEASEGIGNPYVVRVDTILVY